MKRMPENKYKFDTWNKRVKITHLDRLHLQQAMS